MFCFQPQAGFPPGAHTLFSDGSADFVSPAGPHQIGQSVTIRLRHSPRLRVSEIKLRTFPDGEERKLPLTREQPAGSPFHWWQATVTLTRSPFTYRFRIQTPTRILWLSASGLHLTMPPDEEDFRLVPGFTGPAWVRESVFYQIFPDRFRCGKPEISRRPRPTSPTFKPSILKEWHEPLGRTNLGHEFYGGDLWGIIEALPHLERLHINALYLNPIFTAPSNHKYDLTDYDAVDPFLGGNEALVKLATELRRRGMRYVLDGVFNHTGVNHPWFQAACRDRHAPEAAMFTFSDHPKKYVSWLGHANLPKLDFASERVRDCIYRGPDAVARRWLRAPFRADGWRLDAPNMLGCHGTDDGNLQVWAEFRRAVKEERPEAYLVGECFPEATRWLQGETFDAVMNYKAFTRPIVQWVSGKDLHGDPGRIDAGTTAAWMNAMTARMPFALRNLQYNALSTHDIPRFLHRAGREERYRLAALFQFGFPGAPSIYYGEELALPGGRDPDNRRPMPWDQVSKHADLIDFLARLSHRRRTMPLLREGAFRFLFARGSILAYARFAGEACLLVVANAGSRPAHVLLDLEGLGCADGTGFSDPIGAAPTRQVEAARLGLDLPPESAVWMANAAALSETRP